MTTYSQRCSLWNTNKDYSVPYPGHKIGKPADVSVKAWKKHYLNNPCRDWSQDALRKFLANPGGENTTSARGQLRFLVKHNLNA